MQAAIDLRVLAAFTLLWLAIVPTPGPNQLMVTHVALTQGRRQVALAIAGNLAGVGFWALAALFGLVVLLAAAPTAALAVNLAGGIYLVWVGIRMIRGRRTAPDEAAVAAPALDDRRAFALGVGTALSNAQAVIFITSVFAIAGVVGSSLPTGLAAVAILLACNATYLWGLGWLMQRPAAQAFYGRWRRWMERAFGALYVLFGLRLLAAALLPRD